MKAEKGFSFMELLVVTGILAIITVVATPVFINKSDQSHFERTVENMEEIEKALLGITSDRVKGKVRFAGFVQDMGTLPKFYDVMGTPDDPTDDQPRGLWTDDPEQTPDNPADDFILYPPSSQPKSLYYLGKGGRGIEKIGIGWRGPYIMPPSGDILKDGWGNPLYFENVDGDFIITSLGADNEEEGKGYAKDIAHIIRKTDWTGSVSGYVSPQAVFWSLREIRKAWAAKDMNPRDGIWDLPPPGYYLGEIKVRIYYAPARDESGTAPGKSILDHAKYMETIADPLDGYFRFDTVPIGTQRVLTLCRRTHVKDAGYQVRNFGMGYKLAVEPGRTWLGTLGQVH